MFRDPEMPYFFFSYLPKMSHSWEPVHSGSRLTLLACPKMRHVFGGFGIFQDGFMHINFHNPSTKKKKKKRKLRQLEKKWLHSKSLFFFGSSPARVTFGNKTLLFLIRAWSKTNNASIVFFNYYSVSKKKPPLPLYRLFAIRYKALISCQTLGRYSSATSCTNEYKTLAPC